MGGTVGKAVQEVTKPVVKVAQAVGVVEKPKAPQAAPQPAGKSPEAVAAQREEVEDVMAKRRARRGGRPLLSEARLNPEAGVGGQTLGSGGLI